MVGSAIGNVSQQNGGDGIVAWEDVTILNNTVARNTGTGLNLGSDGGYGNNVINGNSGTVTGGVQIGTNLCDGATTCP